MQRATYIPCLVVGLLAIGCTADQPTAPRGIFFPTVPVSGEYPAGDLSGVLEVRSGCVFIAAVDERWLLLWPEGYTAHYVDGRLSVLDANAEAVGREGEPLRVGGGEGRPREMGGTEAAERWATELTGMNVPERCGDLYWIVSP